MAGPPQPSSSLAEPNDPAGPPLPLNGAKRQIPQVERCPNGVADSVPGALQRSVWKFWHLRHGKSFHPAAVPRSQLGRWTGIGMRSTLSSPRDRPGATAYSVSILG